MSVQHIMGLPHIQYAKDGVKHFTYIISYISLYILWERGTMETVA